MHFWNCAHIWGQVAKRQRKSKSKSDVVPHLRTTVPLNGEGPSHSFYSYGLTLLNATATITELLGIWNIGEVNKEKKKEEEDLRDGE